MEQFCTEFVGYLFNTFLISSTIFSGSSSATDPAGARHTSCELAAGLSGLF